MKVKNFVLCFCHWVSSCCSAE